MAPMSEPDGVASRLTGMMWRDGHIVKEDIALGEIASLAHDPTCVVWVDLLNPAPADLASIVAELGLPPTATEDAIAPHERAKVIRHESHLFFTVYSASLADVPDPERRGRLRTHRLSGIVLPEALVTIRIDERLDLAPIVARWTEDRHLVKHGSATLVYDLMDVIVDGHFETIQELDDEIESLEDVLFEERRTDQHFQRRVYMLRKDLVELRRAVLPMREVVNGLLRHQESQEAELEAWYDDLYDHVLRVSEWTESLRDMITSLFETNLSLQDARLNTIMKKLAGWAAIIAVPTAITGWFGQNVPYPGFQKPLGLWLSVALTAVGVLVLYLLFKQRDWL